MPRTLRAAPTLRALVDRYLLHAQTYYRRRDGSPTREHLNLASSLNRFVDVAGVATHAGAVNRQHIRTFREQLVGDGCSRSYVNASVARVRRCFAWAVGEDLQDAKILAEFLAVPPLKPHRSSAAEPSPRLPAKIDHVRATLPLLSPRTRAVVQLLTLTGARVSELLCLRNCDLNTDDETWWAIPPWHKTEHLGHRRAIPLDARCQRVLEPYLRPFFPLDYLFPSPKDAHKPLSRDAVARAIARACKRAGVPKWTPHQVRHAVATMVRDRVGVDAAQILLGHARLATTERYTHLDPKKAAAAQEVL